MEHAPPLRRLERTESDLEHIRPLPTVSYQRLDPKVRFLWCIGPLVFWMVVFAAATTFWVIKLINQNIPDYFLTAVFVSGGLAIWHISWPLFSYAHWGYAKRRTDLLIRSGVFWKRATAVPFARIQHVDSQAGPIERFFGVANLTIHTAGSQMGAVQLPGLPAKQAEALRDELSQVGHSHANI